MQAISVLYSNAIDALQYSIERELFSFTLALPVGRTTLHVIYHLVSNLINWSFNNLHTALVIMNYYFSYMYDIIASIDVIKRINASLNVILKRDILWEDNVQCSCF